MQLRRLATKAVAQTKNGAKRIIELAEQGKLDESLASAAAFPLNASSDKTIQAKAAKLFPLPPTKDNKPLPPITELVKARGDAKRGATVFRNTGQCAKCHVVGREGKDVGPWTNDAGPRHATVRRSCR